MQKPIRIALVSLIFGLKIGVILSALFYLVATGKPNIDILLDSLRNWRSVGLCLLCVQATFYCNALRIWLLAREYADGISLFLVAVLQEKFCHE